MVVITKKEKKYKRNKTQDTPKAWFWKEPRGEGEGVSEVGERMEREGRKILEFLKMKKRGWWCITEKGSRKKGKKMRKKRERRENRKDSGDELNGEEEKLRNVDRWKPLPYPPPTTHKHFHQPRIYQTILSITYLILGCASFTHILTYTHTFT